jgi:hypothetical protein
VQNPQQDGEVFWSSFGVCVRYVGVNPTCTQIGQQQERRGMRTCLKRHCRAVCKEQDHLL